MLVCFDYLYSFHVDFFWLCFALGCLHLQCLIRWPTFQVEDVVSRATDGGTSTIQDLDFSSLRSQLGPLAAVSAQTTKSLLPTIFREVEYLINGLILYIFPVRFFFVSMLLLLLLGLQRCPSSFWIRQCSNKLWNFKILIVAQPHKN